MSERLPCANPACARTILPTTAAETGGICMVCRRAQRAAERADFIAARRRVINPYAGLTDPVALILQIMQPRPFDQLEQVLPPPRAPEDLYASLAPPAAERLIEHAIAALRDGRRALAETAARELACFTTFSLDRLLAALLEAGAMPDGLAFRQAGPAIRDRLLRRIAAPAAPCNALLTALAWIGDAAVVRQFADWRAQPPAWARTLYVAPAEYALEAGWELTATETRRDLVAPTAYPLVLLDTQAPAPEHPGAACPWCGRQLAALLTFDAATPAALLAGLGLAALPLTIRTCLDCAAYALIFTRAASEPSPVWHPASSRPATLPLERFPAIMLPAGLIVADVPRLPLAAAAWGGQARLSQLGGHPAWIDDALYPICPECGVRMRFAGQVAVGELTLGEGMYYVMLCAACLVAATIYQQT